MKKLLQFIFFKIYWFYQKRWPDNDSADYAQGVIAIILSLILMIILFFITKIFNISYLMEGKNKLLIALPVIIVFVATYRFYLTDNRYEKYISSENYELTIYDGRKGNIILLLFFLILVILGVAYTLFVISS